MELAKGYGLKRSDYTPWLYYLVWDVSQSIAFCEENLCGQYNANYACPPDCGSVETLRQTLLEEKQILILQTIHTIGSYENKAAVCRQKSVITVRCFV